MIQMQIFVRSHIYQSNTLKFFHFKTIYIVRGYFAITFRVQIEKTIESDQNWANI